MSTIEPNKTTAPTTKELLETEITREFMKKDSFGDFLKVAVYESVTDPATGKAQGLIHVMNPYDPYAVVVSLTTQATQEDVEQIVKSVSATPEFCQIISKLAECYQLGLPVIIEGGTAVGKTFAVNKFTELLYGKGVKCLDFYCSGQTDVGDLIGKWVPVEGTSAETRAKWETFIDSEAGKERVQKICDTVEKSGKNQSGADKAKMYQAQLTALTKELGFGGDKGFAFQYGAIPKAFGGEYRDGHFQLRDGAEGFICHVQEAGLAKPAVLNALLRIRGEQGALADSIQLWEDSGRVVQKGPRTFIVLTNNPVDGYLDRKPIDPALSRGVEWLRLGEGVSEESVKMTARQIFTYRLGNDQAPVNRNPVLDMRQAPDLGLAIGEAMVAIHQTLSEHFNLGESDDPQRNPVVVDNMFKVAQNLQNYQVKTDKGDLDAGRSLARAITRTYLERARLEDREDLEKLVNERISGTTGKVEFEGKTISLAQKLNVLAARAGAALQNGSGARDLGQAAEQIGVSTFIAEIDGLLDHLKQQSSSSGRGR
jgi:hypothetical protein